MADEHAGQHPAGPAPEPAHQQPYGHGRPYGHGEPSGLPHGYGQPYAPPSWQPPVAYPPPGPRMPQTETTAIVALVLSTGGLFIIPVIAQVVALVLASVAKKHIRASGGQLTGEGLATAAQVVSWIILVPVVLLILFLLVLVFGVASLGL